MTVGTEEGVGVRVAVAVGTGVLLGVTVGTAVGGTPVGGTLVAEGAVVVGVTQLNCTVADLFENVPHVGQVAYDHWEKYVWPSLKIKPDV